MTVLHIISTPIGNPDDITLRALRLLREAALIAAAEVAGVQALLRHYEIDQTVISCDDFATIFTTLERGNVALTTPAGTPGIADPEAVEETRLIREAIKRGVRVEPIPGASALIPALIASGLPSDSFVFIGTFTPEILAQYAQERATMVGYVEHGHLLEVLRAIQTQFGDDHPVSAAVDVSKPSQDMRRGTVSELRAHFTAHPVNGAVTLALGGVPEYADEWDEQRVRTALQTRLKAGDSLSYAAKMVAAESGWKKGDVYELGKK